MSMIRLYVKTAVYNLRRIVQSDDVFSFRLLIALTSLSWATLMWWIMLVSDGLTLVSPTQEMMNRLMPMWAWATLFSIQGSIGFLGALINPKGYKFVILDSLLGALLHIVTTSILIVGYIQLGRNIPPVWAGQIVIAFFAFWALIRNRYDR